MRFDNCRFEGEEYFCTVKYASNESLIFNNMKENKEMGVKGNIQVKMNVC